MKSETVDPRKVREAWYTNKGQIKTRLVEVRKSYSSDNDEELPAKPDVRSGWFPEPQIFQLAALREQCDIIQQNYGKDASMVFRMALSEITRLISYQRNGEFKRYRMAEEDREEHDPDVWDLFADSVEDNITRISSFYSMVSDSQETTILQEDSRLAQSIDDNVADIVITSPPYGDHKTTVAYGQFSQDPGIVSSGFDYDTMREVDKEGLGGRNSTTSIQNLREFSDTLSATLDELENVDGRDDDALNFFEDYYAVMEQVDRVTKPSSPIIWVVANRTMSRVNIPTHVITKELCEHLNMGFVTNVPREIPNKTMPLQNAPENIPGHEGDLMSDENIVVMKSSK